LLSSRGAAFCTAPGVEIGNLRGRTVLFVPSRQFVYTVEPLVDGLWPLLRCGAFEGELAARAEVCEEGAAGQLEPVLRDLESVGATQRMRVGKAVPTGRAYFRIGELVLCVWFTEAEAVEDLLRPLAHLRVEPQVPDEHLIIVSGKRGVGIGRPGRKVAWFAPDRSAPELKVAFGKMALARLAGAVMLHAATLSRDGDAMLIVGPPGAGKSTLAIVLGSAGFALEGDDAVELFPDGQVRALSFPLTVKHGAWPIVAALRPEVLSAPTYLRADGKRLRYLPLAAPAGDRRRVRWIVDLCREASGEARMEAVDQDGALATLLKAAWSEDARLSSAGFWGIAGCLDGAECYRLHYSDASSAAALLNHAWTSTSAGVPLAC
jgi:hypothetical protein